MAEHSEMNHVEPVLEASLLEHKGPRSLFTCEVKFCILEPVMERSSQVLSYPQGIIPIALMQSIGFLFNDANIITNHILLYHNFTNNFLALNSKFFK